MKSECSTSVEKPSLSLIKRICYPEEHKFSTPATRWGLDHEDEAVQCYVGRVKGAHANFTHRKCGLYLSTQYPHIAASPDAALHCDCCGSGLLEAKCPYTQRESALHGPKKLDSGSGTAFNRNPSAPSAQCNGCKSGQVTCPPEDSAAQDLCADPKFCLERVDGRLSLKRDHMYFFQVQTQMAVCNVAYCDFVMWTVKDIHIERVLRDETFWSQVLPRGTRLFVSAILPELLSRYFTRSTAPEEDQGSEPSSFCFCRGPDSGKMVACDAKDCKFKWFHFTCLGLTRASKKKHWYCSD
ncbi:hypothetical protein HPB47_018463 [Ixodes persulcatus]|uniref:Uncharacterized protein n=1 Tax=Ixodes persulcatus TaxID=34615 RepID=A0AC60QMY8_IXOPE|nr:hypothetical protein HPB47_018463 [Ixodes persulcatus]